jgi:hypothetical protein
MKSSTSCFPIASVMAENLTGRSSIPKTAGRIGPLDFAGTTGPLRAVVAFRAALERGLVSTALWKQQIARLVPLGVSLLSARSYNAFQSASSRLETRLVVRIRDRANRPTWSPVWELCESSDIEANEIERSDSIIITGNPPRRR